MSEKHKFGCDLRNKRVRDIMTTAARLIEASSDGSMTGAERVIQSNLAVAQVGAAIVQELDDLLALTATHALERPRPMPQRYSTDGQAQPISARADPAPVQQEKGEPG